ncbi:MAG: succinylglutamate desuccinylase/aspartoacylase family protein [Kiritimatiellae bacterium]|nr:succinylglutamate desuccinylase/aspartoacylase family protein [Kiritimatiellia bacterium]
MKAEAIWEQCAPASKSRLVFECPAAQGVRPVLPVLVLRGAKPGPLLLTIAGQHGRELHGPAGIARVFDETDPATLSGTVVFLPTVNPAGIRMHRQDYPFEDARYRRGVKACWNMNRTWGLNKKSYSGVIASAVAANFIDAADAVLDLHGWYSVSTAWGRAVDRELILAFGQRINVLRPSDCPTMDGMLEGYAEKLNKPFLIVELAPQNTLVPERVRQCRIGLVNVMRHLGMLPGVLELPAEQLVFSMKGRETLLESDCEGICEPLVEAGEWVEKDQLLARVWSLDSFEVIKEFRAPHAGAISNILAFFWGEDVPCSAVVHPGSPVVLVRGEAEIVRREAGSCKRGG